MNKINGIVITAYFFGFAFLAIALGVIGVIAYYLL